MHAHGRLEVIDDSAETQGIMDALVHRFEAARPRPWRFQREERERDALMGAIVAFRMRIRRIDAKFKLSQNRSTEDRARVIAGLDGDGHADATATAAWMRAIRAARTGTAMKRAEPRDGVSDAARVRFDKWLWAARFYKTRSLCAQAIDAGQARVDGERVKAARVMRTGETVSIRKSGVLCEVVVTALSDRRGGAADAALLYRETEQSAAAREAALQERRAAVEGQPRFPGRPTKRERRRLEDFLNEP